MSNTPLLQLPQVAANQNQKEVTINDDVLGLENATQASAPVNLSSGTVTLTATQFAAGFNFLCSGQTAPATLIVPLTDRFFSVENSDPTNAVLVKGATGATVTVPPSTTVFCVCDGTGIIAGTAPSAGEWTAGPVTSVGSGLAVISNILNLGTIASHDLLANTGTAAAVPSATSLTALIDAAIGNTQGDILYRSATAWTVLTPGTAGNLLQTGGAGANPSWTTVTGGSGTVTNVVAGPGLSGGTITSTGTISLTSIAAGDLLANTGTTAATPVATTLTALIDNVLGATQGDILYRSGTVWTVLAPGTAGNVLQTGGAGANPSWGTSSSGVTSITFGAGLSGSTITTTGTVTADWHSGTVSAIGTHLAINSGTIDVTAATLIRTIPFPMVGLPVGSQQMNITLTQAGTLLANGGTPQAYIPVNPASTETLVLNTIHSGTITARGTISISTAGAVTWPTFSAVTMAAGDTVQIVNQATADVTFANACLSLQFQVS